MPQKPLEQQKIEQARELRRQGASIEAIASELGISAGAASKHTRDIPKPVARASVVKKQGNKRTPEGETIRVTGKVPPDEATIKAINEADQAEALTRKARAELAYQTALDEIEDRKQQRRKVFDLEVKAREAEIKESETRAKLVTSPSPELQLQLEQAKSETARLERELSEQRHQQGMAELQRGFQAEIGLLSRQIAGINKTGLTSHDIISQGMNKLENMAILAAGKVDTFVRENKSEKQLGMALSLGLSPSEYEILLRGPDTPFTKAQWQALVGGDSLTPSDIEGYERHLANMEQRNVHYEAVMAKVSQRLGQGGSSVVRTGKPGKAPAQGEPEPPVLKAESRLVTCSRCQTTFDVDLVELRQKSAPGKRLYVSCPNPKCGFLLDLSELLGLKVPQMPVPVADKSTKPDCFVKGWYDECVSELKNPAGSCGACAWL